MVDPKFYTITPTAEELTKELDPSFVNTYDRTQEGDKFKSELNNAQEELQKFDLSNSDKCTLCGAVTTERYACKSMNDQKMWLAAPGERIKVGLI